MFCLTVDLNRFKQFLRQESTFYYAEDALSFVLVKYYDGSVVKTIIPKHGNEQDLIWKENNLTRAGAIPVMYFEIDGKRFPEVMPVVEISEVVEDAESD